MRLHIAFAVAFCTHGLAQQWVVLDGPFQAGRGIAYDSRRGRAVMFGSEAETWEIDGLTRLHRATPPGPFARTGHAMVYDQARGHVLLFGGRTTLQAFGDTWLWDGTSWRQPFSATSPSRRTQPGIAYDSVRQRVVLFSGQDTFGPGILTDTWEHDGTQWLQRTPATVPSPPNSPLMTFDSARNVTVLVMDTNAATLSVFEWNGNDWLRRTPATGVPTPRSNYTVCYDPVRQRTVLFGGNTNGNQIWEWDGAAWQLMGNAPTAPIQPGMYFDPVRSATVIVGTVASPSDNAGWTWDGTTFQSLQPVASPRVGGYAMYHDPVRNRTVLLSGSTAVSGNETWEWDGNRWTLRSPVTVPPPRLYPLACFDTVTATGLVCGLDCWRFDGTNWTAVTGSLPTARTEAVMAWDPIRNEAILFGGLNGSTWLADTWRFDGTNWTQVTTAVAPPGRFRHAMAFDPQRGRIMLFGGTAGGFTPSNSLTDSWDWDGTQWQPVVTPHSPPQLGAVNMIHHPVRGRMLLVGLQFISSQVRDLQAWEYDGADWALLHNSPGTTNESCKLIWDPVRQRALLFNGSFLREQTWGPASVDVVGTGCGTPPPLLSVRARPRPGDNQYGLELSSRPNLPVLFAFGWSAGSTPLGNGCTLLVQQVAATAFVLASGNGMSVLPVAMPPNMALRGITMHAQAGALDPAAPGGLAVSHALRITVGD